MRLARVIILILVGLALIWLPNTAWGAPLFTGIYWIDGRVLPPADNPSVPTDNRTVVLYKTSTSDGYASDLTGPSGLSGLSGRYLINALGSEQLVITPETYFVAVLPADDGYYAVPVAVTITGAGFDTAPDLILTKGGHTVPPVITVEVSGVPLKSGDYIDKHTRFDVSVYDTLAVDPTSLIFTLDGGNKHLATTMSSTTEIQANYVCEPELADGSHDLTVEAKDIAGNLAVKEYTNLQVSSGAAALIGPTIASPTVFSPSRDKVCLITYTLNHDAGTGIYMYGISGDPVWIRKYETGVNGGKAGYNAVAFSGQSDLTGTIIANGIYVYRVVSDGKVVGKGHVVVYE